MTVGGRPGSGGKQARRHRRGQWIGMACLVLAALVMLGLGIYLAVGDIDDIEGGARAGLAAFFGVLTLLMLGLAWHLLRKLRPPAPKGVKLDLAAREVRRGQPLQAVLTLAGRRMATPALELALVCVERYDVEQRVHNPNGADYDQRVTREHEMHREAVPVTPAAGPQAVTFTVPPDGPFSYEGECVSAVWKVSAHERRPNRPDRKLDEPLWVYP